MTEDFPGSDYAEPFPLPTGRPFVEEARDHAFALGDLIATEMGVAYPPYERIAQEVADALGMHAADFHESGSGYYFGFGNDIDVIVYSPSFMGVAQSYIESSGYTVHPASFYGGAEDDNFFTARKGNFNLIVYHDKKLFDGQVQAGDVCRLMAQMGWLNRHDFESKDKVVAIHRLLRDGLWMQPGWTLAGEKEQQA